MKQAVIFIALMLTICHTKAQNLVIPIEPDLIFVEGGEFIMGSESGNPQEKPLHDVSIDGFYIGKYEVTVGQYKAFCKATSREMPNTPVWGSTNDNLPIVMVTYNDCVAYCNWLGDKFGGNWRLPTEAEWEYAARGGKKSNNFIFSGSDDIDNVAWYSDNSAGQPNQVGKKKPNELGIYDMSGNVWEWCRDRFGETYYSESVNTNPRGPENGIYRVLRGGGWFRSPSDCRVARRGSHSPVGRYFDYGFRVAKSQELD